MHHVAVKSTNNTLPSRAALAFAVVKLIVGAVDALSRKLLRHSIAVAKYRKWGDFMSEALVAAFTRPRGSMLMAKR